MREASQFPNNWNEVWLCWAAGKGWDFFPCKMDIPDGAVACRFVRSGDPFKCKVVRTIEEQR